MSQLKEEAYELTIDNPYYKTFVTPTYINHQYGEEVDWDVIPESYKDTVKTYRINCDRCGNQIRRPLEHFKLESMFIEGSRSWDLTMEFIPVTLKNLVINAGNLNKEFMTGMERLVNLELLNVDDEYEFQHSDPEEEEWNPFTQKDYREIVALPRLRTLILGNYYNPRVKPVLNKTVIRAHPMFVNYHIRSIEYTDDSMGLTLSVISKVESYRVSSERSSGVRQRDSRAAAAKKS